MAIKSRGTTACTNFPATDYDILQPHLNNIDREAILVMLKAAGSFLMPTTPKQKEAGRQGHMKARQGSSLRHSPSSTQSDHLTPEPSRCSTRISERRKQSDSPNGDSTSTSTTSQAASDQFRPITGGVMRRRRSVEKRPPAKRRLPFFCQKDEVATVTETETGYAAARADKTALCEGSAVRKRLFRNRPLLFDSFVETVLSPTVRPGV